ncbi:hypothetical protein A6046_05245 [[Haemophilus] ducreyi]|uniref:Mu-like prophage FluMu N-terminal domain-containing protein n=2 Tax=Haemophilus ducreyi TaxID=730 RepID=Q7VNJ5_HAEDU|nr:hypothetical protein [[Haemophilus] ducreyi]AAP95464.1 hypothetical protein HD_0520 [[Haemophilus] ducreyi 35000HP]AKO30565.1 hypothetical protein RY60_02040 [[Haemophilus] ducreyi]AKO32002.1 hypothetical protein RZ57_02045 [[Haemophilus] ducreyi]AKO33457.1 hypothetical protein RZ58_02045 [[Haemophilus] ducreyi]AKO34904.1 hypothetical protein RZ59_02030 [[Haemophilus] ducreyi]
MTKELEPKEESKDDAKTTGDAVKIDESLDQHLGEINPVAYTIRLKAIHPQESYGRCGYRFNKLEAINIAHDALTGEQIITLANDPYLELVPVVKS